MLKKEANKITGGLSAPGKMPEGAYSISALHCKTGAKLRLIKNTPCHGCYALKNIFEVCNLTPDTMHWLPTQERQFLPLPGSSIPKNLIIRLSNAKNDTVPGQAWSHWSTVVTKPRAGHVCPAPEQGNNCGDCRACWSKDVKEVQYKIH